MGGSGPGSAGVAVLSRAPEDPGYRRDRCTVSRALRARTLPSLLDDGHDVVLAHHEDFVTIDLHGLARILAEEDTVADLHV
jgi:hypothetical protein